MNPRISEHRTEIHEGGYKIKIMKDRHQKSYHIVTYLIKSNTFCIRKGIHISEVKTVIYPVNHCPEISLTVNQLYINDCEKSYKKRDQRNNTEMRIFEILLFSIFKEINSVQYRWESHNYIENKCHTM